MNLKNLSCRYCRGAIEEGDNHIFIEGIFYHFGCYLSELHKKKGGQ